MKEQMAEIQTNLFVIITTDDLTWNVVYYKSVFFEGKAIQYDIVLNIIYFMKLKKRHSIY